MDEKDIKDDKDTNSSGALLDILKDEYSKTNEISSTLDNKSSFFMSAIFAITTIFIPIIPFDSFVTFFRQDIHTKQIVAICFIMVLLFAFITVILAFGKFYNAYKITNYMAVSLGVVECHKMAETDFYEQLCLHYKKIIDYNTSVNDNRCRFINTGISFCFTGFAGLVLSTIALIIIIGE